jgi:threonine dehydratase
VITLEDVTTAARQLDGVARRTPVLTSTALDRRVGASVFIKAESFQRAGSFKFRGAYTKTSSLGESDLASGVISISSGNHAQALALASSLCGTRAVILMPEDSPATKVDATRAYGAEVIRFDRYEVDMDGLLAERARERGLTMIHPYDDWAVMAGQGTAALELLQDVGELDLLLAPVGGGGLIAGCATAAKGLQPTVRVVGVEPAAGDDTQRSLRAGRRVHIEMPRTIADGQQLPAPGELTFEVIRRLVDDVVTVTDDEIVDGMIFLFERVKVVAEPSGACALAALLAGRLDAAGRRVGVILSGGNISCERFCDLLNSRRLN